MHSLAEDLEMLTTLIYLQNISVNAGSDHSGGVCGHLCFQTVAFAQFKSCFVCSTVGLFHKVSTRTETTNALLEYHL